MAPDKKLPTASPPKPVSRQNGQVQSRSKDKYGKSKGLEILDFHESWLEEMEIYKDKIYLKKHAHHQAHSYDFPMPKNNQIDAMINSARSDIATRLDVSKKSNPTEAANANNRIIVRNGTVVGVPTVHRESGGEVQQHNRGHTPNQLHLKRSHDGATGELPAKRNAQAHPHGTGSTSAKSGSPPKVIVNQFHAKSLLSAHEDKTKILTQNGLAESAAAAYETSQHASHSLPPENRSTSPKTNHTETSTHTGISGTVKTRSHSRDPSVVDYSGSGSDSEEEEYVGQPFFIGAEADKKCQSSDVHCNPKNKASTTNEDQYEYFTPKCVLSPSLFPNVAPYLNFSSHSKKGPAMPVALHKVLKWKLSPVMPKIVKRVVLNSGFRVIKNTTDWMAIWEKHMKSPGFRTIRSHQKYNHLPGSFRIGRKDTMWRNIYTNMKKFGSDEFGFMQKTYIMPEDQENLRQVWPKTAAKRTKWIVKPPASARGTGIRIVNKWSQFNRDRPLIVQKYIERPLLINDNKFDMRLYVLLTSVNPLRLYMYKDGLARFASVKYSSELDTLDDRCMHLTNYSINKYSQNYSKNEDFNSCQGHKWTLQSLWSCLESRGVNTKRLWATLRNLVIKSIVSGESGLNRMYRQNVNFRNNCFELFGFDVLLDENLVPWLLEINISPSLHSELPLDLHVKGPLIQAVLNTALYQVPPKLSEQQKTDICKDLGIECENLCFDSRLFTTCLTAEEVRKHNMFTHRSIEFREEYIESILEDLQPDDVRCLILSEDELNRSHPLERIFPTADTHQYLKYTENPRYYNRLLDAWEYKYGKRRSDGIALLRRLSRQGYHLLVSKDALDKEPNIAITEIDLLHVRKSDVQPDSIAVSSDSTDNASKAASPKPKPRTMSSSKVAAPAYSKGVAVKA